MAEQSALPVTTPAATPAGLSDGPAAFPGAPTDPALTGAALAEELDRKAAAVALNYSRTSFHRIRRYPSKRVLMEEQLHILNNLNLNGIADEEVVRLYTSVLAEITEVQIAEQERRLLQEQFRRDLTSSTVVNAYALAGLIAEGHYIAAVKTGVRSWWDYRGMKQHRDIDLWKVDKQRMLAVVDKSAQFLDTFWKLTRRRSIPDRWLIRDADLDRLEEAVQEPDPQVRLRVLLRMAPFMECCPPWWYYVGRTQQQLGQLFAAANTFRQLEALGQGHFRKDQMLAAGTANLAIIEDFLGQPQADETASRALAYASGDWEVNVGCARVLLRHGRYEEAEDAVLRNLDTGLETRQSLTVLLAVYRAAGNRANMVRALNRSETAELITAPVLLECLAWVGFQETPPRVVNAVYRSLEAGSELSFGADSMTVVAASPWRLDEARGLLELGGRNFTDVERNASDGWHRLRFRSVGELGTPLRSAGHPPFSLLLAWPESSVLRLHLEYRTDRPAGNSDGSATDTLVALLTPSRPAWRIVTAEVAGTVVDFDRRTVRQLEPLPETTPAGEPITPPLGEPFVPESDQQGTPARDETRAGDSRAGTGNGSPVELLPLAPPDENGSTAPGSTTPDAEGPQFPTRPAGTSSDSRNDPPAASQVRYRPISPDAQSRWKPAPRRLQPVRPQRPPQTLPQPQKQLPSVRPF